MPRIAAIVKLTAQAGKRDELVSALKPLVDGVADEPGTLAYALHTSNSEDDVVWFYELYSDQAALDTHSSSDTMKAAMPALAGLLGGRPEMHYCTPVGGKGLDLG